MRLAYFSPLNPQRSGISDYSEELLPHLAAGGARLTLFVDGFRPASRELLGRFPVRDYRRDPATLEDLEQFDAAVYHVGNDHRYHAGVLDVAARRAGVVVLHDFALQDFFLGLARQRGDLRIYLDEVEACHGAAARLEAEETLARGATPSLLARPVEFPLNRRIVREAEGVIVHSEWARERLERIAPGVPIARVPMPVVARGARVESDEECDPTDAPSEVRIANFGLITPGKGIERALAALSRLKQKHRFRYTLVGEPNDFYDVRELIRRHRMEDRVEITGHLPLEEFERRMCETDIALNLRERTVGETSASLCRLMAAGVCTVVADVGWYSELPSDSVVKIGLDETTDALLLAYLERLLTDRPLREAIGRNARRYALAEHAVNRSASLYLDFIRDLVATRARRHFLAGVSKELALLGADESDGAFLHGVAAEVAALAPAPTIVEQNAVVKEPTAVEESLAVEESQESATIEESVAMEERAGGNGHGPSLADSGRAQAGGRLPKIEGVNYKRAAIEYPQRLDAERRHYLLTKPFYNLANKPIWQKGDGMDAETQRHFCDFANVAASLALPAGSRILDVGCGSGWLSEYFARLGYEVRGIDISPDLIEMARRRVASVPFDVDHQTPLRCSFAVHDIEAAPLREKFDAVICYDSLHHFEDERAVVRHLALMLDVGGQLFILEGVRPPAGSETEEVLRSVMARYSTLESPFDEGYLRSLLDEQGLAVVGDYVSVNGLFEREMLEGDRLPLEKVGTNYHYLTCKKVCEGRPASTVPDSRNPSRLRARFSLRDEAQELELPVVVGGETLTVPLAVTNAGDTLWLAGRTPRAGVVMPAVRIFDATGTLVSEFHGQPLLPRAVAPGETIAFDLDYRTPRRAGDYALKVDMVAQHVCWFEQQGSEPLIFRFAVA
jgi:glycosyltransferase involved in cell wall biosynthesis/SAM-dependent methyltransferase